ncbi:hypothetical protein B4168_1759 [Anoxybacillus flavithermus]|nr:hypothetical protein B4168_1759 [Anoxybacillus flavithermus]OAO84762.1 hypothetical protein GT23_3367 [Parageobacillus thermoglucosidasius]
MRKRRIPLSHLFTYLVNYNVFQTFVEGLPVLRQIFATFILPVSH